VSRQAHRLTGARLSRSSNQFVMKMRVAAFAASAGRVILNATKRYAVGTAYRRGGFGYLRKSIQGWNAAAKGKPFVVLTDLDAGRCPPELIPNGSPLPSILTCSFASLVK